MAVRQDARVVNMAEPLFVSFYDVARGLCGNQSWLVEFRPTCDSLHGQGLRFSRLRRRLNYACKRNKIVISQYQRRTPT